MFAPSEEIQPLLIALFTDDASDLVTNGSFTGMNFLKVCPVEFYLYRH